MMHENLGGRSVANWRIQDGCVFKKHTTTWNPKQPFINGCFNWRIPNLCIENGFFTKHPFINGCLGFQAGDSNWILTNPSIP